VAESLGSTWRVAFREADGTEREVSVQATEAWTEGGETTFVDRRVVGGRFVTKKVLRVAADQLLSYERLPKSALDRES
jgi:hypothetical protein